MMMIRESFGGVSNSFKVAFIQAEERLSKLKKKLIEICKKRRLRKQN